MKKALSLFVITSALFASGCASLTHDAKQTVSVTAVDSKGVAVADAACTFTNDRGETKLDRTPGIGQVYRSAADMTVVCKKEGLGDGMARLISRAGRIWGNIILGGGIGAIVDHSTGKGYNYPDIFEVAMGKLTVFDRSQQDDGKPARPVSEPVNAAAK